MTNLLGRSQWVWNNDCIQENVYVTFYESLYISKKAAAYQIYISADSQYVLYINDRFVNCGQYADYPDYKAYDELDITAFLREGDNEIRIEAYWYGMDGFTYRKESPGVIYAVVSDAQVLLASGKNTLTCHNDAFESKNVEKITNQLLFSFKYDATKAGRNKRLRKADIQEKTASFYPRPIKKLDILDRQDAKIVAWGPFKESKQSQTIGETMQNAWMGFKYLGEAKPLPDTDGLSFSAGEILPGDVIPDGFYLIIDMGAESIGYLDLDIELPSDSEILIGWGEHLEDLRVRTFVGKRNFAAAYKGQAGHNRFTYPFRRLGLRYLQLHIYAPSAKIYYAGILPTLYPLSDKPYFRCADHLHDKIYEVAVNTLRHCMHEHYEDCPWREQALYTMDSRNQMLCGYYAFGEFAFAKASLRLMGLSIRDDNMLELCSPARIKITIPCFTAVYLVQLYEYLIYSGDKAFIDEMLPVAKRIADSFIRLLDEDSQGLLTAFVDKQYWNYYEWQEGLSGGHGVADLSSLTYDAPLNAFVSLGLSSLAKIYAILGDKELSGYYDGQQRRLNAAIDRAFFDEQRGVYAAYKNVNTCEFSNYAELTQALVVCCGACPQERLAGILAALTDGSLLPVTLSHSIFKYEALLKKPEKYGRYVFDDIAKLWGHMLYHNATTFWETIDGASAFANAGSLCHGWSAVPIYFYFRYAAGLKVSEDGKADYQIEPVDSGLYACRALIETPGGEVAVPRA